MLDTKKENKNIDSQIEHCVICGCPTPYSKSLPVSSRRYFIEGAGQLCEDCFYRIYSKEIEDIYKRTANFKI